MIFYVLTVLHDLVPMQQHRKTAPLRLNHGCTRKNSSIFFPVQNKNCLVFVPFFHRPLKRKLNYTTPPLPKKLTHAFTDIVMNLFIGSFIPITAAYLVFVFQGRCTFKNHVLPSKEISLCSSSNSRPSLIKLSCNKYQQ